MNDPADGFIETATFCKTGDDKRPGVVATGFDGPLQVCVDDLTKGAGFETEDPATFEKTFTAATVEDAVPLAWYARIEFDELLDPAVETLVDVIDEDTMMPDGTQEGHIKDTLPVTLKCDGVDVPYDGYYSPSGNNVTWPVGPSLVVRPLDPTTIKTGAACTIEVKSDVVKDKDGVGATGPAASELAWSIAPLSLDSTDPKVFKDETKDPTSVDPAAPVLLTFNAAIDVASLTAAEVTLTQVTDCAATTGTARVATISAVDEDIQSIAISDSMSGSPDLAFVPLKTYLIRFSATNEVADVAGGTGVIDPDTTQICIKTTAAM